MADILYRSNCILGEAAVWHKNKKTCLWVDVESKILFEYQWETKEIKQYEFDNRISLVVPAQDDRLILALQGGLVKFDTVSGRLSSLPSPLDVDWGNYRFNDGGCDVNGRLWVSTMDLYHREGAGAVYCIDNEGQVTRKIINISIPNGFVWSPDHKKLYYTDSVKREVYAYLFDAATGQIGFEGIVIRVPENLGLPDGMAMDAEGMLWIALWDGYGVGRFDPANGRMIDFINVPAPQVTCCCFAGDNLDHLVITTARSGMTPEALRNFPESGSVFITKMNVSGTGTCIAGL